MKIDNLGTPVLETPGDRARLDTFLDNMTDKVYGRLPRFARLVVSRDAFRSLLGFGADELASRASSALGAKQSYSGGGQQF